MKKTMLAVWAILACGAFTLGALAAGEITATYSLTVEKDYLYGTWQVQQQKVDVAGSKYSDVVQAIGTNGWTQITVASGVGSGMAFFRNTSTNTLDYIKIGPGSNAMIRLEAGKCFMGRVETNVLFATTVTATNSTSANLKSVFIDP